MFWIFNDMAFLFVLLLDKESANLFLGRLGYTARNAGRKGRQDLLLIDSFKQAGIHHQGSDLKGDRRQGRKFVFGELVRLACLYNQNADHLIAIGERDADKGVQLFFLGFCKVAVVGVVLAVGKVFLSVREVVKKAGLIHGTCDRWNSA